jgi:O-acetyl-ADP-ribose deacetylase (regulator of RNase III)
MNPKNDGIDHINVYSKGKTLLGRLLTNFAESPFICEDGHFESIEGYWYWLGCRDDKLRKLSGYAAKEYGRKVGAPDWISDKKFKLKIILAIRKKIEMNPNIKSEIIKWDLTLPLKHYYYYGSENSPKVIKVKEADWILEELEKLREECHKEFFSLKGVVYKEGDVLKDLGKHINIVAHGCNCLGAFNAGIAKQISINFKKANDHYIDLYKKGKLELGFVQVVKVGDSKRIANCGTQYSYGSPKNGAVYLDYTAFKEVFEKLYKYVKKENLILGIPKIGAGLAGGDWIKLEKIIQDIFHDYPIYVYTLK